MIRELICVACPIGCSISVEFDENNNITSISGNQCKWGEAYAVTECTAPTRSLTSTVKVTGGKKPLVPVKTEKPIPKEKMLESMAVINSVTVKAPVKIGDVIIKNALDTGVDIVATGICPAE